MSNLKPRKRVPNVCNRCGARSVAVRHRSDVLDYKGLTLDVDGLADTTCDECHYEWTTDGQEKDNLERVRIAFAAKRDALRASEGLLTGEQIEDVLDLLGLSRSDAANLFGGGPNAFGKYISGEVLQSLPMDRLLRLTLAFGANAVRLLRMGKRAPLGLNSAGFFVAPVAGPGTHFQSTTGASAIGIPIVETRSTCDAPSVRG